MSWNHEAMRLGDRERRQALKALDKHHAKGRIDDAEYAERSDAVGSARTVGDLLDVFADLGWGPRREQLAGRAWSGPVHRGPFPLLPLLLVVGIVLAALGHVPWLPVIVVGALVLLLGPWHHRRRWAGHRGFSHRGYAC